MHRICALNILPLSPYDGYTLLQTNKSDIGSSPVEQDTLNNATIWMKWGVVFNSQVHIGIGPKHDPICRSRTNALVTACD